jgi:hypothetical protein
VSAGGHAAVEADLLAHPREVEDKDHFRQPWRRADGEDGATDAAGREHLGLLANLRPPFDPLNIGPGPNESYANSWRHRRAPRGTVQCDVDCGATLRWKAEVDSPQLKKLFSKASGTDEALNSSQTQKHATS